MSNFIFERRSGKFSTRCPKFGAKDAFCALIFSTTEELKRRPMSCDLKLGMKSSLFWALEQVNSVSRLGYAIIKKASSSSLLSRTMDDHHLEMTTAPTEFEGRPQQQGHHQRRISFGTIQIYEFMTQIGDNPAVSSGCPIALGWEIQTQQIVDVDVYERDYPSGRRKSSRQLRIPMEERTRILMEMGHTRSEIVNTARDAYLIRDSRRRSTRQKQLDVYYGALVSAGRGIALKAHSVQCRYSCYI